jgi:1-acyl-sn-glycerol-3-phosphate acyltransferase
LKIEIVGECIFDHHSFLINMAEYKISRTECLVNEVIYWLLRMFVRMDIEALAQVPQKGPLLLITNHINFLEGPIVYTNLQHRHKRDLTGFAKIEFWDNPITAFLFETWETIPLRRGEADLSAIKEAVARIKTGAIFAMAPEGTRSSNAQLLRAHPGIAMLAHMSGAPILPLAGFGHENYVNDLKHFRRPTYNLVIGKMFRLDAGGNRVKGDIRQEMADEIMYQLAALLPEKYRGVYGDLSKATTNYLKFDNVD